MEKMGAEIMGRYEKVLVDQRQAQARQQQMTDEAAHQAQDQEARNCLMDAAWHLSAAMDNLRDPLLKDCLRRVQHVVSTVQAGI